ncbi:MAG TPA: ATP-binding cassette domain-containing protein [Planctomycetes bacterium]|nr:ATP-binding cassette domain-containing protein [Planctomycetota bacterium]
MTPRLEARGLTKIYPCARRPAVDGVDLMVAPEEVVAVVGESGAGKSTLARLLAGLLMPTDGCVLVDGKPFATPGRRCSPGGRSGRDVRRKVQIVFQSPGSTLNPRFTVAELLSEGPLSHGLVGEGESKDLATGLLEAVELGSAYLDRLPDELSGGQKQRVALARALSVEPEILILDEVTSALDADLQVRMLELLQRLKTERGLSYVFISHDLALVESFADRVAVMRRGRVLESARTVDLYERPRDPYTMALLRASRGDVAWVEDDPRKDMG